MKRKVTKSPKKKIRLFVSVGKDTETIPFEPHISISELKSQIEKRFKRRDANVTIKEVCLNSGQRLSLLDDEEIIEDVLRDDESIIVLFENQGTAHDSSSKSKKESKEISDEESSSSEEEKPVAKKKTKKPAPKKRAPAKKKKPAKKKTKRDPNAPKKPSTAYMYFLSEKRPEYKEKYEGMSLIELLRKIANEWKQLSDEEKKPYVDKHLEDKKRYEKEMKNYTEQIAPAKKSGSDSDSSSEEESSDDKKKKKKRKASAGKPKAPVPYYNAFMCFQKEQRENLKKENPNLTVVALAKKLGEIWHGWSDKEKQHYIELAEKDKERYERERQEYLKKR